MLLNMIPVQETKNMAQEPTYESRSAQKPQPPGLGSRSVEGLGFGV